MVGERKWSGVPGETPTGTPRELFHGAGRGRESERGCSFRVQGRWRRRKGLFMNIWGLFGQKLENSLECWVLSFELKEKILNYG